MEIVTQMMQCQERGQLDLVESQNEVQARHGEQELSEVRVGSHLHSRSAPTGRGQEENNRDLGRVGRRFDLVYARPWV